MVTLTVEMIIVILALRYQKFHVFLSTQIYFENIELISAQLASGKQNKKDVNEENKKIFV